MPDCAENWMVSSWKPSIVMSKLFGHPRPYSHTHAWSLTCGQCHHGTKMRILEMGDVMHDMHAAIVMLIKQGAASS